MQISKVNPGYTHHVPYGGGSIAWHEFGEPHLDSLPLVLLHGGHGSWEHWYRNIDVLSRYFQLYVPDMPGFGESTFFDGHFQSGMLDPLIASLNAVLGDEQALNIAGFSFGGFVAAHIANQRKGVQKLCLLGSAGHGGPRRPRGELLAWKEIYASGDDDQLNAVMRENLFRQMIHADNEIDDSAIRIHRDACVTTRFRSKPIARPGGLAEQLEAYAGPALLIWGEHDITCTPDYLVNKLVAGYSNRSQEIISDAGHWVQYEKPEQINPILIEWFK